MNGTTMKTELTASDQQPPIGTVVRDASGVLWERQPEGYWLEHPDGDEPESWVRVAGDNGPVQVADMHGQLAPGVPDIFAALVMAGTRRLSDEEIAEHKADAERQEAAARARALNVGQLRALLDQYADDTPVQVLTGPWDAEWEWADESAVHMHLGALRIGG